jgi:hypothetical protein
MTNQLVNFIIHPINQINISFIFYGNRVLELSDEFVFIFNNLFASSNLNFDVFC